MSAITVVGDLEIEDPGCVHHIREHLANGCPLEPLVEAVVPMSPEERAPLVAGMVEKARSLIASRNDALNELIVSEKQFETRVNDGPKRGRKASPERAAVKEAAKHAGVSESTVRRDLKRLEPTLEPVVAPAPKPPSIEVRLRGVIPELQKLQAVVNQVRDEMQAAADQNRWNTDDVRWRLLQGVDKSGARLGAACIDITEVVEKIEKARVQLYAPATRELGEKPAPGPGAMPLGLSEAPKKGLQVPKKIRVQDEAGRSLLPEDDDGEF